MAIILLFCIFGVVIACAQLPVFFRSLQAPGEGVDSFGCLAFFAIGSMVITIIGSILSGGFADIGGYRYYMFPIALLVLVAALYFRRIYFKCITLCLYLGFFAVFSLLGISAYTLYSYWGGGRVGRHALFILLK